MNMQRSMGRLATAMQVAALTLACISCHTEARNMTTPRIDKLFEKTKPVCFGRFVLDVPASTTVVPGPQAFGPDIESLPNDVKSLARRATAKRDEVQAKAKTIDRAEVISLSEGPTRGSWTLMYWEDDIAKDVGIQSISGFLAAGMHGFTYFTETAPRSGRTVDSEMRELTYVATHLRPRDPSDIPADPGVCLDVGFIADDSGKFQEIFGVGLRFAEWPDVSFSVSSNKDADQGESFEARRAEAKRAALLVAPLATLFNQVKTLREGKLKVQQGQGSEALFRRPMSKDDDNGQGVWHEFLFEYAGKRYDHRNPSWDASLLTGVAHNNAGSIPATLTDDEAVALWDRLMASVRLRVPAK